MTAPATARFADGTKVVRAVDHAQVLPGRALGVGVAAGQVAGRVVLEETVTAGTIEVVDVHPTPVDVAEHGDTVAVAWDLPVATTVHIAYRVGVPASLDDGDILGFEGSIRTAGGDRVVAGTPEVEVVTDLLARVSQRGQVTDDDVRSADAHRRAGALDREAFAAFHDAWLAEAALEPPGDGGDADGDSTAAAPGDDSPAAGDRAQSVAEADTGAGAGSPADGDEATDVDDAGAPLERDIEWADGDGEA